MKRTYVFYVKGGFVCACRRTCGLLVCCYQGAYWTNGNGEGEPETHEDLPIAAIRFATSSHLLSLETTCTSRVATFFLSFFTLKISICWMEWVKPWARLCLPQLTKHFTGNEPTLSQSTAHRTQDYINVETVYTRHIYTPNKHVRLSPHALLISITAVSEWPPSCTYLKRKQRATGRPGYRNSSARTRGPSLVPGAAQPLGNLS